MRLLILFLCVGLIACSPSVKGESDDTGDTTTDTGTDTGTDDTGTEDTTDTGTEDTTDTGDDTTGDDCPAGFATPGAGFDQGDKMTDLTLNNCAKESQSASALLCKPETKLLLLSFGAGWCGPCREEQPILQEFYTKYGSCGLEIVTILAEQNEPGSPATSAFCDEWTAEYSLTFGVWTDPLSDYWTDFMGAGGALPVVVLTTPDWTIQYKHTGSIDPNLETVIKGLLPGCP